MNNVVSLAECCTFIKDGTHGSPARRQSGIPVLSAAHVRDGRLYFDTDRFTSDHELLTFQKRLKPMHGDVLLTIVGTIGRTAIIDGNRPFVFQRSVCVLRPKENVVLPMYLKSALESEAVKSQFHVEKHEVAQAGIYLEALNEIKIPLPSLPEQKRIATVLDKADRLRRTRRYVQELSDTFLQAVFLQMFGDPLTNPRGWDMVTIDDAVAFSQYGTSQKNNQSKRGYPVLGMGNVSYSGSLLLDSLSYVDLTEKEFEILRLVPGDVIFNRTNSTELVGKAAHWNRNMDAVLASYLIKLRLTDNVLPDFFVGLLNTRHFKRVFQERCKKAVGQSNISPTLLKEFPIYVPPLPLQDKFGAIVRKAERLRAQQREAERQAEHLFQTLLHRAFSPG